MSETVIFSVGLVILMLTTSGVVLAGGIWLAESDGKKK